jgi:hypothetical protein
MHTALQAAETETTEVRSAKADVEARCFGEFLYSVSARHPTRLLFDSSPLFLASAEEVEASFRREQAEELRRRLNDLEDRHDDLTRAAEVAVAVVGPGL